MRKNNIDMTLGEDFTFRGTIFKIGVILIFVILSTRMLYLQVLNKEKYKYLAQKNRMRLRRIEPERGNIYDVTGELVVTNVLGYRLIYLNRRSIDDKTLEEMSQVTGYEKEYLAKRIKYGEIIPYTNENVLIEDMNLEIAHKLMEKLGAYSYMEIQSYSKRKYVFDSLAAHTIGYVKKITKEEYDNELKEKGYTPRDIVGKIGVEKIYDFQMKGELGYDYVEVNALNKAQKIEKNKEPEPGYDLHLSIDMRLQRYIEEVFKEENLSGSLIVLNAKTGKVLTMVSYPTYSLNMFSSRIPQKKWNEIVNDPRKILSNKSIAGEYPPGSVFKPFSAFGFFKNGLSPKTEMNDTGSYSVGGWTWRSWKYGGHGRTNFEKSIVESVNSYYYKFADEYGLDAIRNAAADFGYGKLTQIDVSGERTGVLPNEEWKRKKIKERWYKGDTIPLAIGQGYMLTTPLQVAVSYMGLANKGKAYVPSVVDYLKKGDQKKYIEPKVLYENKNYPVSYYRDLNKALIKTVEGKNGTAKTLRTEGLVIAAKSGSSQNSRFEGTHALVAGYFPANKEPEIVFTVLLEGAGGGGVVAGGVAKKFVDKYLEYYK